LFDFAIVVAVGDCLAAGYVVSCCLLSYTGITTIKTKSGNSDIQQSQRQEQEEQQYVSA